ncbi:MAG: hypothetical protein ACKVTZ_03365 [Bacteroidia bacterium]
MKITYFWLTVLFGLAACKQANPSLPPPISSASAKESLGLCETLVNYHDFTRQMLDSFETKPINNLDSICGFYLSFSDTRNVIRPTETEYTWLQIIHIYKKGNEYKCALTVQSNSKPTPYTRVFPLNPQDVIKEGVFVLSQQPHAYFSVEEWKIKGDSVSSITLTICSRVGFSHYQDKYASFSKLGAEETYVRALERFYCQDSIIKRSRSSSRKR